MHLNSLVSCFKPICTNTLILSIFILGNSCTFKDKSDAPEHLSNLQNLVIIQQNSETAFSIELSRDLIINDSDVTKTWFNDMTSGGFPFGGVNWCAGLEIDDFGRIFVGNRPIKTIQVFNSDGSYLTNIGSEGNGPGEFNGILDIKIQANQLYAFDYIQFRTTFFSIDSLKLNIVQNAYLNRFPDIIELTGWYPQQIRLIDDYRFLVGYMEHPRDARIGTQNYNLDKERTVKYYTVNRDGKVVSKMFFKLKDHMIITADVGGRHLFNLLPVQFLNRPLVSISDDGYIVSANSEESLIKMYDSNGDYLRAFYIQLEKKSLLRNELIELYSEGDEENENLLIHAELPETWPALGDVIMDDENRLWVSTIPDSEDLNYDWWVLQDSGELFAKFRWPGNRSIEKIKDGYVYARETDESTGQQTIVKYRVGMN